MEEIQKDLNVQIITKLGEGGFGKVFLAKEEKSSQKLAVKVLEKRKVCQSKWTLEAVKREKSILVELYGSPWFTNLIFAKHGKNAIYLGLEFYVGSDLFGFQQKYHHFNEDICRFYIAEIIVAVDALHRRGIIHRDLKRENIFLKSSGHIVIGDFGLSKQMEDDELAYSKIGTTGYIAPEVFADNGYSFAVDIFAVGVMFIELLTGFNPFIPSGSNLPSQVMFNYYKLQVTSNQPHIHSTISKPATEIGLIMLNKDPVQRMNFNDLKKLKFFEKIKWTNVESQRLQPPYVFSFPSQSLSNKSIQIDLKEFNGNVTFNDFNYDAPPSQSRHENLMKCVKDEYGKQINDMKNEYKKKLHEMQKALVEMEEKMKKLRPENRKRPGPRLQNYNSNENKILCIYCNRGLSDIKALKKHIKAIHTS